MRLIKNYKLQLTTKRKAFTLMEILIASSIFAVVLVMATAVLGQSSTYQTKLSETRKTSREVQSIADMITRDVRSTNGDTLQFVNATYAFKNGIFMFKFSTSGFAPRYHDIPGTDPAVYDANVLVLDMKTEYAVYFNTIDQKTICYGKTPKTGDWHDLFDYLQTIKTCTASSSTVISSATSDVSLKFGGFAPNNVHLNQQPYVMFDIVSKTKNYGSLPVNSRATAELRSTVTSRSYNQ